MSFLISLILALSGGGLVALLAGENPLVVYKILAVGSFGSLEGLGFTLFYATPFIFTGLAVALPYRVGLFNIGGEGQLYLGAVGIMVAETVLPDLGVFSPLVFILFGAFFGALWASLVGILKVWRGCHEVITSIMLNFIGLNFASYAVLYFWKDPTSQRPESLLLRSSSWLPSLHLGETPLNFCFILALLAAFLIWFFLEKTSLGFRLRATGMNPSAARVAGFSVSKGILLSMVLAGILAAGASANELLGHSHRFIDGFSSGYGFVGIAVAFLGRNHPLGVVLAGIFFGALFKGASDLDIETTTMTRDFSVVLQALFIAAVAAEGGIKKIIQRIQARWMYGR